MFKIFISYRRQDQETAAILLSNGLNQRSLEAWLDVATIPTFSTVEDEIAKDIASSDFVFVLISNQWVETTKSRENAPDFVRFEIETALQKKIPLVPLLIDDVELPDKSALPQSITRLVDFQAFRINPTSESIQFDIDKILSYLENRYSEKMVIKSQKKQVHTKKGGFKIFINYRRKDSQSDAGRIFERLAAYYGKENVLMDIDSIPLSVDFRAHINSMIGISDVVLVLIGVNWLQMLRNNQPKFMSRFFSQEKRIDWVETEIVSAVHQEKKIVPILLGHFPMPAPELLPGSLRQISFINGQTVDPGIDFNSHMNRLIQRLDTIKSASITGS